MAVKKKNKIYAVAIGRDANGEMVFRKLFNSWDECNGLVNGVPQAKYKSFNLGEEVVAYKWMDTVIAAEGYSFSPEPEVTVSPVKINIPKPFTNAQVVNVQATPVSSNGPIPVGELQVTPLLQWQPEPLPESLGGNAVDIQFDIVCYRFGLKPDQVMNHLKRQFLETFGTMEKPKG